MADATALLKQRLSAEASADELGGGQDDEEEEGHDEEDEEDEE